MDFVAKLSAQAAIEKITKTGADRVAGKFTARIDEAGDFFRRQRGVPAQQREMQADSQFGGLFCERHRFVARGLVHHQAGGGQNPFAMRADDGLIDGV